MCAKARWEHLPTLSSQRGSYKYMSKTILDMYGYSLVNGCRQYGRYESSKDGKETEFVAYGKYIGIELISEDLDGGSPIVTIGFLTMDGKKEFVNIRRETLGKKKELQAVLLRCNADAYDFGLDVLMKCLRMSETKADKGHCFHSTGWIVENVGLENEILTFKGNNLISSDPGVEAEYVGQFDIGPRGSFSDWKSMIHKHVLGRPALELAVLIGLSPIISSEWGSRNLIFHFMGDSGTGKTTSAILALSTIGCPNPSETKKFIGADGKTMRSLMSSWKGTSNALIGKLEGLDGILMVFDELSKVESTEILTSTIYTLSDGADKDRMMSPTEMQTTNLIRTNILSVGEESLLEKANNQNSGLSVRVCEISTEFTESPEQAEAIAGTCYKNYGHAAAKFVRYIVDSMSYAEVAAYRERNLNAYCAALNEAGCQSKTVRRLAEFGAVLLTVADIASVALNIPFSKDAIIKFLVEQQMKADRNTDIGVRAHDALLGYINTNIGSFITDESAIWNKSITCLGKIDKLPDGGMEVSIPTSEFPKILTRLGFNNPALILKKFKDLGVLKHEAGKNYRKRQITRNGTSIHVNVIVFPNGESTL